MDIGIDLGTTFSTICVNGSIELDSEYGEGKYLEDCDVTIIPGPYGEHTFPSVIIEDPYNSGNLLFGMQALEVADTDHAPIMFSKRKIGTDEVLHTGNLTLTAKEVAVHFLSYLKQCAENALGGSVGRAVVTHPAYFDRIAVEHTREAAIEAGLDMGRTDQMLMEPVAAALAYTKTDKRDPLNVMTYDLGGGTFDVTVLQRSESVIEMKAFDGDPLLGGYNFDRELVDWVRRKLETRGRTIKPDMTTDKGRAEIADLLIAAERLKIGLAKADRDDRMVEFRERNVVRDVNGKDVPINERISRNEFVEMIKPQLKRTIECCMRSLEKAKMKPEDIDEVLLVGGSSYGPWIINAIRPLFPNVEPKLFAPDLCVVIGAAIHCDMILPKKNAFDEYTLELDVPGRTAIDSVNIIGEITDIKGNQLPDGAIKLFNESGTELYTYQISGDGKFSFLDIELMELDASNQFILKFQDNQNRVMLTHSFDVIHESNASDTSAVTTVLPKPLFFDTFDGLVPLAEEGVALPARIHCSFERMNNNPNFDIELYQEGDVIGTIRIENIPPEAGRGAILELKVEVTQKNEIKGKAIIRTRDNSLTIERDISLKYHVFITPGGDELVVEQGKLAKSIALIKPGIETDDGDGISEEVLKSLQVLIAESERLLQHVPIESQEVSAIHRRIRQLLDPPRDDMRPTKKDFFNLINRCKTKCRELLNSAKRITEDNSTGKGLDLSMVQSAERTIGKAEKYLGRLEKIESSGKIAAQKKDRKNWLLNFDKLRYIESDIKEDKELQTPPTIINKLIAKRDIVDLLRDFFERTAAIESAGKIGDWSDQLTRIHKQIMRTLLAINNVDSVLDDEEGLNAIRTIYIESVKQLRKEIETLGASIKGYQKLGHTNSRE